MQRSKVIYRRVLRKKDKTLTTIQIHKETLQEFNKLQPKGLKHDGFLQLLLARWRFLNENKPLGDVV